MAVDVQNVSFIISAVDQATRVLQGVGTSLGGVMKSYQALQGLIASAGVALGMQKIADATIVAERASFRLDAALKATGMAAGVTRAELDEMAESLKQRTPFDDDEIRKGLSALIRFRDVQGDIFRQAAQLAPDLAAALDTDVVGAYTRLGRALEDPEKGLRALREAGLNVTSTQEKVKKSMAETGDVAAAQKIILDDLAKSVGGAAAGENAGVYGSFKAVGKAFDDFLKGLGQQEHSIRRMKQVADWASGAMRAVTPGGSTARGPTQAERSDALRGQSEAESARLIEGYQKTVAEAEEKYAKETAEREKRLRDEDIKGWIAHAEEVFRLTDEENKAMEKIHDEYWAREERLRQEDLKGWVAYAEEIFRLADEENLALARIADDAIEKNKRAIRELGLVFSSAFEDAIVNLEKLRNVLQALAKDLLRMFVRKTVTEPGGVMLANLFGGLFTGGSDMGGFASGGSFNVAGAGGTDSQRVSFWATPGERVTVTPPGQPGGGVTIVQHMTFGSDVDRATLTAWGRQVKEDTISAVYDRQRRGSRA